MNLNQFTQKSVEAVQAAQQMASARQNQQIEQEHLLLALLEQKEGLIPQLIQKAGVEPAALRQKLTAAVERLPQVSGSGAGQMYLSRDLEQALNEAEKDTKLWCLGIDLGAVHAVNCRLRRPQQFAGAIGLSGIYDLTRFWGSEADDLVLRASPLQYLTEKGIANKLALAKAEENSLMLCAGQGAYEGDALADTQALADVLAAQGLPAHLEVWGGDVSHEWYWWGKMLGLFVPRILEK